MSMKVIPVMFFIIMSCIGEPETARSTGPASPQNTRFVKVMGAANPQEAFAIIQARDGSFVILGITTNYGTGGNNLKGQHDVFLVKFSSSGSMVWARTLGKQNAFDIGLGLVECSDGGFLLTGVTDGFGAGKEDILVSKFDENGDHQWSKTIGGSNDERGFSLVQAADGSYILVGRTFSFGAGDADLLIVKLDSSGNPLWTKSLGGKLADFGSYYGPSLILTSDSKILVAGSTINSAGSSEDALLCKLDLDGNLIWARTIGGSASDIANSVFEMKDGTYMLVGATYSFGEGENDALMSKFRADGTHIGTKTLGGASVAFARARTVVRSTGGGYAIGGNSASLGSINQAFFVSKFDDEDTLLWTSKLSLGDPAKTKNITKAFLQSSDGGYLITGETVQPYMPRIPLVKLDSEGNSCLGSRISLKLEDQKLLASPSSITIVNQNPRVQPANPTIKSITPAIATQCEN